MLSRKKRMLKRFKALKTIITKHIMLQINPDVAVTENRCCKDHPLEGKYKQSMHVRFLLIK
jgi:hypothetical protein